MSLKPKDIASSSFQHSTLVFHQDKISNKSLESSLTSQKINILKKSKETLSVNTNNRISVEKHIEKLQNTSENYCDTSKNHTLIKHSENLPSIGPLHITDLNEFLEKSKKDFDKLFLYNPVCNLKISDFNIIKKIGKGSFGRVILAELTLDETLYAIKLIEKKEVLKKNYVRYVINEKRILQSVNFPFVVKMKYFFVDYKYMYFVMPFIPGGDFNNYLYKQKILPESHAKFYIGQLVLALEYLHYMDLIHRDVKPENVIIDVFGYIKLADFGQCVKCHKNDKTWTIAGTPEYIAPEVIVGKGYDCAVDWWSLGVFTFEMCAGHLPFLNSNIDSLYRLILTVKYQLPDHFSRQLKSFLKSLLVNNPESRVANRSKRAVKLKSMTWLKSTDWLGLLNRTLEAPYLPDIHTITTSRSSFKKSET